MQGVYNGQGASVVSLTIFEDETFSAPNVVTGTVRVLPGVLTQNHVITTNDVISQSPSIANALVRENNALTADDVTAQSPTIDNSNIVIQIELLSNNVETQSPTIGQGVYTEQQVFTPVFVMSGVDVGTATISQLNALLADDVITGNVDVGTTQDPWSSELAPAQVIFTTQTVSSTTYSTQLPPSETWTDAA